MHSGNPRITCQNVRTLVLSCVGVVLSSCQVRQVLLLCNLFLSRPPHCALPRGATRSFVRRRQLFPALVVVRGYVCVCVEHLLCVRFIISAESLVAAIIYLSVGWFVVHMSAVTHKQQFQKHASIR